MYQLANMNSSNNFASSAISWNAAPLYYSRHSHSYPNISMVTPFHQELSYSEVAKGVQDIGKNIVTMISHKITDYYQNLKQLFVVQNGVESEDNAHPLDSNFVKQEEVVNSTPEKFNDSLDQSNMNGSQDKTNEIDVNNLSDDEILSLSVKIEKSLIDFYCDMTKFPPDCSDEITDGKKIEDQNTKYHTWLESKEHFFLNEMTEYIKKSVEEARLSKKPLMLLLGEDHYSELAHHYEAILVKILSEQTKMRSLLTEPFTGERFYKIARDNNLQHIPVDYLLCFRYEQNDKLALYIKDDCDLMRKLLTKEQLEKYAQGYEEVNNSSESLLGEKMGTQRAIQLRNEAMSDLSHHLDLKGNGDTALVVGELHNQGLIELLSQHFYVVPFYLSSLTSDKNPMVFRKHEQNKEKSRRIGSHILPMYDLITSNDDFSSRKTNLEWRVKELNELCKEDDILEICTKIVNNLEQKGKRRHPIKIN